VNFIIIIIKSWISNPSFFITNPNLQHHLSKQTHCFSNNNKCGFKNFVYTWMSMLEHLDQLAHENDILTLNEVSYDVPLEKMHE